MAAVHTIKEDMKERKYFGGSYHIDDHEDSSSSSQEDGDHAPHRSNVEDGGIPYGQVQPSRWCAKNTSWSPMPTKKCIPETVHTAIPMAAMASMEPRGRDGTELAWEALGGAEGGNVLEGGCCSRAPESKTTVISSSSTELFLCNAETGLD
jgi:hypothetical protein